MQECVDSIKAGGSTSFVVFGSLARSEATSISDVDWSLLVNGPTELNHYQIALEIRERLEINEFIDPGKTGVFGGLISSHDLVHHIGGGEDTNANMTRRLLMLLESCAITGEPTREQTIARLLQRYIVFGRGVGRLESSKLRTPRFLLNDFARYWRTLAVDYAAKKWYQNDKKWALRNTKLRFSRKLISLKGFLTCIDCEISPSEWPWDQLSVSEYEGEAELRLQEGIKQLLELTPLESLCRSSKIVDANEGLSKALSAYNEFLEILDDEDRRKSLESVKFEAAAESQEFDLVRRLSREFDQAIESLLFESNNELLKSLARKHGVF